MEKNTLVLILDPKDPQVFDLRQPAAGEPVFGIVQELLDHSGQYQEFRCKVRHGSGAVEIFPVGRLVPLLIVPDEDLRLIPKDIFAKWAAVIVKRMAIAHLPMPQRDFLFNMLTMFS